MDGGTSPGTGALDLLAAELDSRGLAATPVRGSRNVLRVSAAQGSGLVAYQAGKFWWHDTQEPVAPSCDIGLAAVEIARVLATGQ